MHCLACGTYQHKSATWMVWVESVIWVPLLPKQKGVLTVQSMQVVHARGPISDIPDRWSNRRDMFAEIDKLQRGWTVELRSRGSGSTVDACFFDPQGEPVGSFAVARRKALVASKA